MSRRSDRRPTFTSVALAILVEADDFCSMEQIHSLMMSPARGLDPERVTRHVVEVTLAYLSKHKAADSLVGGDDRLWWFAQPTEDDRSRIVEARVPEEPGSRRTRKSGHKKGAA